MPLFHQLMRRNQTDSGHSNPNRNDRPRARGGRSGMPLRGSISGVAGGGGRQTARLENLSTIRKAQEEKRMNQIEELEHKMKQKSGGFMKAMEDAFTYSYEDVLRSESVRQDMWVDNTWVLNPRSPEIRCWTLWMLLLILITGTLGPFEIAFHSNPKVSDAYFVTNRVLDVFFLADMVVSFMSSYLDRESGLPVVDLRRIRKRYMRVWFWIDLLGIIPFDALTFVAAFGKNVRTLRIVRLLRLFKLLRLLRATRLLANFETEYSINYNYVTLAKFGIVVFFLIHLMACGLFIIESLESNSTTWLDANDLTSASTFTKYVTAVYWATMTISTIGYGDIGMITDAERLYATVCMMIGASVYAFVVGDVCNILVNMDVEALDYTQTMSSLNTFMAMTDLPQPLRVRIRQYFSQVRRFNATRHGASEKLMWKMSPFLRGVVAQHMNNQWIKNVPFFEGAEEQFVAEITMRLKGGAYSPRELICREDDYGDRLFIVRRGTVMCKGRLLISNRYFGEDMILRNMHRRGYAARALQYVDISYLMRNDLFDILQNYPALEKQVRKLAIKMAFRKNVLLVIKHVVRGEVPSEEEVRYRQLRTVPDFVTQNEKTILEIVKSLDTNVRSRLNSLETDVAYMKRVVEKVEEQQRATANSTFTRLLKSTL